MGKSNNRIVADDLSFSTRHRVSLGLDANHYDAALIVIACEISNVYRSDGAHRQTTTLATIVNFDPSEVSQKSELGSD